MTVQDQTAEAHGVSLTDPAAAKVKSLLEQEGREDLRLSPDPLLIMEWLASGSRVERTNALVSWDHGTCRRFLIRSHEGHPLDATLPRSRQGLCCL